MYEVIIEYDNQGPVVVMRSQDLSKCLDKQKRLIQDGHLDCFIARVKKWLLNKPNINTTVMPGMSWD